MKDIAIELREVDAARLCVAAHSHGSQEEAARPHVVGVRLEIVERYAAHAGIGICGCHSKIACAARGIGSIEAGKRRCCTRACPKSICPQKRGFKARIREQVIWTSKTWIHYCSIQMMMMMLR